MKFCILLITICQVNSIKTELKSKSKEIEQIGIPEFDEPNFVETPISKVEYDKKVFPNYASHYTYTLTLDSPSKSLF